jgi:hypothetical protein
MGDKSMVQPEGVNAGSAQDVTDAERKPGDVLSGGRPDQAPKESLEVAGPEAGPEETEMVGTPAVGPEGSAGQDDGNQ